MATSSHDFAQDIASPKRIGILLCAVIALVSAILLSIAVSVPDKLLLSLVLILCTIGGYLLWKNPSWTTYVVLFLLYTNLPVVAVNFHGAPGIFPALTIGLLLWPLAHKILAERKRVHLSPAFPAIVAFAVVQFIGSLFSKYSLASFEFFLSFLTEGLIVFLIVDNLLENRIVFRRLLWTLSASAILMGGVPLVQQLSGNYESEMGGLSQTDSEFKAQNEMGAQSSFRQKRFAGTIGEQNRFAQFMIILLPVGVGLFLQSQQRSRKILAAIAILCAAFGFALAFSRGAAVGFVLAFSIGTCLGYVPIRQIKWLIFLSVLVLLALPQYSSRLASISTLFQTRSVDAAKNNSDGSIRGRLTEMGAAALVFRDHVLVGVGPGVFREYSKDYGQRIGFRSLKGRRQAHCMPLDIAAENGLLGLLSFAGMLWILLRDLNKVFHSASRTNDREAVFMSSAISMSLLLFLTTSLFLHMSYIRYFWLLMAICSSAARVYAPQGSDTEPPTASSSVS